MKSINKNPFNGKLLVLALWLLFCVGLAFPGYSSDPLSPSDLNRLKTSGSAVISPDGKWIAYTVSFQRDLDDEAGRSYENLYLASTVTTEIRGFITGKTNVSSPLWSPDGKELALEIRRGDDIFIGIMPSAGGTPELLNEKRGLSWAFSYSPDGRRIAFAGYRDDTWNLWWIDRKTREEKRLTTNTRLDVYIRFPSWSPKGDRIVYEQAETRGQVFLLDGGRATPAAP